MWFCRTRKLFTKLPAQKGVVGIGMEMDRPEVIQHTRHLYHNKINMRSSKRITSHSNKKVQTSPVEIKELWFSIPSKWTGKLSSEARSRCGLHHKRHVLIAIPAKLTDSTKCVRTFLCAEGSCDEPKSLPPRRNPVLPSSPLSIDFTLAPRHALLPVWTASS